MAAAAACLPQGTAFPQPPEGAFNLYGTDPRWNNDMINLKNWNEMMRRCRPPYEHQMNFEFTPSPFRDNFSSIRRSTIMSGITQPNENDVLMGRGGKNNQFVGNERLRVIARTRCQEYKTATKKGKSQISRELVEAVRRKNPPGRFLKKNDVDGTWEDVGDEVAREKTSQVLRDAINSVKTFSSDPPLKDATPPLSTREVSAAVTHEKSSSFQEPTSFHAGIKRPSSADSRGSRPVSGWSSDYAVSPAMRYPHPYSAQFSRQSSGTYFRPSSSYMHHQYAVTPSSSTILPHSAAKKRSRIYESPLVAGYHRPMTGDETPKPGRGTASAQGTPNMSLMYSSPPNPRKQGFVQTPPAMSSKSTVPSSHDNTEVEHLGSDLKPASSASGTSDASFPSPSVCQSHRSIETAAAGQPSGESSDCWINDLHQFRPVASSEHLKPAIRRQSMGGASEFDPFNDDLLSDSEQGPEGAMSPFPFFYPKRDSI